MGPQDVITRRQDAAGEAIGAFYRTMDLWRALALDLPIRLTAETMRFVGQRLQADAAHIGGLENCTTLEELVKRQSAFVSRTVGEYQTEAASLSEDVRDTISHRTA